MRNSELVGKIQAPVVELRNGEIKEQADPRPTGRLDCSHADTQGRIPDSSSCGEDAFEKLAIQSNLVLA
jgi:hypothetical protein